MIIMDRMLWNGFVIYLYLNFEVIDSATRSTCGIPPDCCEGFQMDSKLNKCRCMSGYYGPNCSSKCRYPNYGLACQLSCNCSEDHCHYIMGCRKTGCPPGYYEINCSRSCRFPNYGIRCQQECVCSKELCHHITGCRAISTTDRSTEIVSTYKMETWNQDLHNQNCSSIKVEDRIFKRLQFLIIFSLMTVSAIFFSFYLNLLTRKRRGIYQL
ncbi:uncharacterized protein LOC111104900 [Crassostrea virginica]